MTKHCQISVATAQDWVTPSPSDKYCIVEPKFLRDLHCVNARDVFYCNPPFISVYLDASDVNKFRMLKNIEWTQSST